MRCTLALLAAAGVVASTASVQAAGPFDGTWQVEAAPTGGRDAATGQARCEGLRLRFDVKDNQIQSSLARSPPTGRGNQVTQTGRNATPITGTVQPDGTVNAHWERYNVTGKLTHDKAELHWTGQCGPRVAMGERIASTEGSGSTKGKQ